MPSLWQGAGPDLLRPVMWEARAFLLFQQAFGAKFINPDIEITSVIGTVLMIISIYLLGIKTWITGTCVPDVFTTLAFGQRHINI